MCLGNLLTSLKHWVNPETVPAFLVWFLLVINCLYVDFPWCLELPYYNLVNFDKVSKINFDYLFIWIDWFRLWSLFNFNSVHLNAAFLLSQIMAHPNITLNLKKLENLTLMIKLSVMQINASLLRCATKPSTYWRNPSNIWTTYISWT